jgi:hypothetical protein
VFVEESAGEDEPGQPVGERAFDLQVLARDGG